MRTGFSKASVPKEVSLLDDDTTVVVASDSMKLPPLHLDDATGIQMATPPAAGARSPLLWGVGAACVAKSPMTGPAPVAAASEAADDAAAQSAAEELASKAAGFDAYVLKAGPTPLAVGLVTPNPAAVADPSQPPYLPVIVWRDHVVQVHRPPAGAGRGASAGETGEDALSMPPRVRRQTTTGSGSGQTVATAALPLGHGLKSNSIVRVVVDPESRRILISADGAGKPVVALSQNKPEDGTKASILDEGYWVFDKSGCVQCELLPAVWLPSSLDSVYIRGSKSTGTAPGVAAEAAGASAGAARASSRLSFLPSSSIAGKVLKPLRDLPWFDQLCQLNELAREMGEGSAPHALLRNMLPAYAASSMSVLVDTKHPVSGGSAVWQRDVAIPGASALRVIFDRESKLADGEILHIRRSDLGAAAAPLGMSTGAALPGSQLKRDVAEFRGGKAIPSMYVSTKSLEQEMLTLTPGEITSSVVKSAGGQFDLSRRSGTPERASLEVGSKVVRDELGWCSGNQDGGPGQVGVVESHVAGNKWSVKWMNGHVAKYHYPDSSGEY